MVKRSERRHSPLDDAQVKCSNCKYWPGEHIFECPKARSLTVDCLKWCVYFEGVRSAPVVEVIKDIEVKPQADAHGVRNFSARNKKRR